MTEAIEQKLREKIAEILASDDPAHDLAHVERVVAMAKRICAAEAGDLSVVVPAAWLHDLVNVPKNDPSRSQASRLSAEAAQTFLREIGYDESKLEAIGHAIEAHSFSANISPRTIEAKIVQDADRLDGIGAVGIARLFLVAGQLKRPIYRTEDPFARNRPLDDSQFTIDHVYKKLFLVADSLQTEAGREEGAKRKRFVEAYLRELESEI